VDVGCERSFLVRLAVSFSLVLWGSGLRFGTEMCFSLGFFVFLSVVIALPRTACLATNLGDGWSCVM